ncbi:hypothetical protein [Muricoccus radiodurans]|uniref:hypothetical protein n=1 Tax=Muricoccus radiodurans TaxID=2231721 RepID=UPI003CECF1E9
MPYLIEALLFLAPFALFLLWTRLNPRQEAGTPWLLLALVGLVLSIGAAAWYGLSRSMAPGTAYVPPSLQNGHIAPGHADPLRPPGAWPPVGPRAPVPPPYEGPPAR